MTGSVVTVPIPLMLGPHCDGATDDGANCNQPSERSRRAVDGPFRVALVAMALIAALGSLPASARGGGGGNIPRWGITGGLQSRFRRPRLQPWLLRATLRIQSWFRRTALRLFWPSGLCRTSCVCRPGLRCAAAVVGVGTATAVVGVGAAAATERAAADSSSLVLFMVSSHGYEFRLHSLVSILG